MRSAPPVDYPLAHAGYWAGTGGLLAVFALTALLCAWVWHGRVDGWGATPSMALACVVASLTVLLGTWVWRWRASLHRPPRFLRWDGACWELHGTDGSEPLRLSFPAIRVDLGAALLLRAGVGRDSGTAWLPLERRDLPAAWHALRVALGQPRTGATGVPEVAA